MCSKCLAQLYGLESQGKVGKTSEELEEAGALKEPDSEPAAESETAAAEEKAEEKDLGEACASRPASKASFPTETRETNTKIPPSPRVFDRSCASTRGVDDAIFHPFESDLAWPVRCDATRRLADSGAPEPRQGCRRRR